jgi:hypothetical protein
MFLANDTTSSDEQVDQCDTLTRYELEHNVQQTSLQYTVTVAPNIVRCECLAYFNKQNFPLHSSKSTHKQCTIKMVDVWYTGAMSGVLSLICKCGSTGAASTRFS